jgi:hypothetical protein
VPQRLAWSHQFYAVYKETLKGGTHDLQLKGESQSKRAGIVTQFLQLRASYTYQL